MRKKLALYVPSLILALFAGISARADYSNTVMTFSPVAYWPLNETNQPPAPGNLSSNLGSAGSTYDGYYSSSAVLGTSGALVASSDTAATFDGSAARVAIPYSPALTVNAPFTAEGWYRSSAGGDNQCALSLGHFGTPRAGWLIYKQSDGWNFRLYNQNANNTSLDIRGGDTSSGFWHHVVAVYDGANGSMYVDGALVAGPTAGAFVANTDGPLMIGARSDNGFFFPGDIDEVAIYTNALSGSTILAHYQNGTNASPAQSYSSLILASNPKFYYRLNETLTTPPPSTATATNYGSLGAVVNGTYLSGTKPGDAGPPYSGFGAGSRACKFIPESAGYVNCTFDSGLDITTAMSVAAWIKTGPADSRFQSFLGKSDHSWRADIDPSGFAHWADGSNPDATGTKNINDGAWHFFTGVYDGSNCFVYVDGVLDGSSAATTPVSGDTVFAVIGGVADYTDRYFKGSVAQVAIFTNALADSNVLQLYFSANPPPYITQQPASQTNNQGTVATFTVAALGLPTLKYQWYKGASPLSGQTTTALTLNNVQPTDQANYTVVVTNNNGAVTSSIATLGVISGPPILVQNVQPLLQTNFTGMPTTFSVAVGGTPPFAYQWKRDGGNVAGATGSSYTFPTLTGTHTYSCQITNAFGSTNSSTATVVERYTDLATTFVVNFHDAMAAQFAATPADGDANNWLNVTYTGLGAYADNPSNTNWNGFGFPDGYLPILSSSTSPQRASDGSLIPLTLTTSYASDNGALYYYGDGSPGNTCANCPSLVMGYAAVANGANPFGNFTLHNVPPGTYSLYLYGANFDNNRGASFTVSSGNPHNGWNTTTNANNGGPANSFDEGITYVYFTNVTPNVDGTISGTWGPMFNPNSGNSGEGDFNGLQLVKLATTIPVMTLTPSIGTVTISWTPAVGILQSATSLAGPWTDIPTAAPPYPSPTTGVPKFYRIRL